MRVRLSRRASAQVDSALAYVASHSPQGADNVGGRLREILRLLSENAEIGRVIDARGVRRFSLHPYPYLLDYHLRGGEVVVLRFLHAAGRPPSPSRPPP